MTKNKKFAESLTQNNTEELLKKSESPTNPYDFKEFFINIGKIENELIHIKDKSRKFIEINQAVKWLLAIIGILFTVLFTLFQYTVNNKLKEINILQCKQRKTIECFSKCDLRQYMIKVNECENN